jgi:hypothetical protein
VVCIIADREEILALSSRFEAFSSTLLAATGVQHWRSPAQVQKQPLGAPRPLRVEVDYYKIADHGQPQILKYIAHDHGLWAVTISGAVDRLSAGVSST